MDSSYTLPRSALIGAAVAGVGALFLYLVTMAPTAMPGDSARLLVTAAGLDPFPLRSHILWNAVVWALSRLSVGELAVRVNLFSVFCGGTAVVLMYLLMERLVGVKDIWATSWGTGPGSIAEGRSAGADAKKPRRQSHRPKFSRFATMRLSAAIVSAFSLAVSVPFWMASTRAHFAAFEAVMHLVLAHLLLSLYRTGRTRTALAFSFLYGLALTESAILILAAPVAGFIMLWAFIVHERIRMPYLEISASRRRWDLRLPLLCLLFGALGMFPYFVKAALMAASPAAVWMGLDNFWAALVQVWRDQYWILQAMLPREAWMLLPLVTAAPLILMIFTWTSDRPGRRLLTLILYVGLLVFALGFVNEMPFSPGGLAGYTQLMVTPYVVHAAWFGFMIAALLRLLFYDISRWDFPFLHWRPATVASDRARVGVAIAGAALVSIAILCAPFRNWKAASGRPARFFDRVARRVLADCGDRTWFVSGGGLDDIMVLRAAEERRPLRVIKLVYARSGPYLNYIATLFKEARLQGLAAAGLDVLLPEWFAHVPDARGQTAVSHVPELWRAAGLRALPMRTYYAGLQPGEALPDKTALVRAQDEWLQALEGERDEVKTFAEPWRSMAEWHIRHGARLANDLGVTLEDTGDIALARQVYERVIRFDPGHLSAHINLAYLLRRHERPEADALEKTARDLVERAGGVLQQEVYGWIRDPRVMVMRGMQWAHAGRLSVAASDFASAMELGGTNAAAARVMASLLAAQGQDAGSRAMIETMLARNPDDPAAQIALAMQLIREGRMDEGLARLDRVQGSDPVMRQVELLRASVELQEGRRAAADKRVAELLRRDPQDGWAWMLRLLSCLQTGNERDISVASLQLAKTPKRPEQASLLLAYVRMLEGDLAAARRDLEGTVKQSPAMIPAWEMLIWLDYTERKQDVAEKHAHELLRIDPNNATANHFMGSFQLGQKKYVQAEASLRTSLARRRDPAVLNDLAWSIFMQGRAAEALPFAREAAAAQPESAAAVDTLAAVLAATGARDEALEIIDRLLEKQPDDAQLRERRKELERDQKASRKT